MKVKKGDKVKILSGKDRGSEGKVINSFPEEDRIIVDGINLVKKHRKPRRSGEKGERITKPAPIDASNVQLICPKCGKPTRIGHKITNNEKARICKKCEAEI